MATLGIQASSHGALGMVDTDLPLIRALQLSGYPLLTLQALAKRLNAPGPLDPTSVSAPSRALAVCFAPA